MALFPFVAIVGTVLGSLIWGYLGDRIGRRASILLAGTVFIGTAMCSAMPAFWENLVACLFMGMSAGGLLPIVYSLLTEMIPARKRGEIVVLVAGVGTALGFLFASWTAHWLIPTYSWRIMWFFGVPTGLALVALNRYIPESPRFLLANGRTEEAHEVMRALRHHSQGTAGRGTWQAPERATERADGRLPAAVPEPDTRADDLRAGLGTRQLRLPRLAAGPCREGRHQRRPGDNDPGEGGTLRRAGLRS